MRKLVATKFLSLDGVFQAPEADGFGFKYEGWTFPYMSKEFQTFQDSGMKKLKFKGSQEFSFDVIKFIYTPII